MPTAAGLTGNTETTRNGVDNVIELTILNTEYIKNARDKITHIYEINAQCLYTSEWPQSSEASQYHITYQIIQ